MIHIDQLLGNDVPLVVLIVVYYFPSKLIVCIRLGTGDAGMCSYWDVRYSHMCLYPWCTACVQAAAASISVCIDYAHAKSFGQVILVLVTRVNY